MAEELIEVHHAVSSISWILLVQVLWIGSAISLQILRWWYRVGYNRHISKSSGLSRDGLP